MWDTLEERIREFGGTEFRDQGLGNWVRRGRGSGTKVWGTGFVGARVRGLRFEEPEFDGGRSLGTKVWGTGVRRGRVRGLRFEESGFEGAGVWVPRFGEPGFEGPEFGD
jgi:hypothetical protein